eukprot:scaffold18543_cov140-Isochrysis_galbana.AAC.3
MNKTTVWLAYPPSVQSLLHGASTQNGKGGMQVQLGGLSHPRQHRCEILRRGVMSRSNVGCPRSP